MDNATTLFISAFAMGRCELGDGEVRVLTLLREHGPSEVTVLAKMLKAHNMVSTSMALTVARKHGFVEWVADEADNRKRTYIITKTGLAALKEAEADFAKNMKLAVGMLGKK